MHASEEVRTGVGVSSLLGLRWGGGILGPGFEGKAGGPGLGEMWRSEVRVTVQGSRERLL